jgi:uncharacterized Ntn-hydrolase superfamily protein
MTYSIIGRDPATGAIGGAAQSRWFNVGPQLLFVEHGVGAVATQSFVDPRYGPLGLQLMRLGRSAEEALAALVSTDIGGPTRQVAMLDGEGRFAQHTGDACVAARGGAVGRDCAAQGNMLTRPVWDEMVEAFEGAGGPLAERLVAALAAAEEAGGDARGSQSAAVVVRTGPGLLAEVDLRVVDHPQPVAELSRLLALSRAYDELDTAIDLAIAGDETALERFAHARLLAPGDDQITFWHAVALAALGRLEAAQSTMREARAAREQWPEFLGRVVDAGLVRLDPDALASLQRVE